MQLIRSLLCLPGVIAGCTVIYSCNAKSPQQSAFKINEPAKELRFDSTIKTIHVFVALCDNIYQGIVPVPARIGNGQDPHNNLYWGCAFGMKTFFKNSTAWNLIRTSQPNDTLMERLIFRHKTQAYYLVADAYNGKYIKQCTIDFLKSSSGRWKDTIQVNGKTYGSAGNATLTAYIGHDGLMDFSLSPEYQNEDGKQRSTIILACISKRYFAPLLKEANINPVLWSTNLMSPEAYTLHDALEGYVQGESNEQMHQRAAAAYSKYQKCSLAAAKKLVVSGW